MVIGLFTVLPTRPEWGGWQGAAAIVLERVT